MRRNWRESSVYGELVQRTDLLHFKLVQRRNVPEVFTVQKITFICRFYLLHILQIILLRFFAQSAQNN